MSSKISVSSSGRKNKYKSNTLISRKKKKRSNHLILGAIAVFEEAIV